MKQDLLQHSPRSLLSWLTVGAYTKLCPLQGIERMPLVCNHVLHFLSVSFHCVLFLRQRAGVKGLGGD